MDILAVQQRLIDNGYQFIEHIYNDELAKEGKKCYITITSNKDPSHHWERSDRMECWRMIAEWLDKKEIEYLYWLE